MVPNMQMSIPRADMQDQDCLGAAVCDTGTWHQSLKKFGFKMEFRIILLPEYLIHYVSANPLLEAEGKKFMAPFWGEPLEQSTLQNEMQYCHLLPGRETSPLCLTHSAEEEINVSGQGIF